MELRTDAMVNDQQRYLKSMKIDGGIQNLLH